MSQFPDSSDERLFRLSEYLDGTLEPAEREALERELARDEDLAAEFEALRRVSDLVRESARPAPELDWERFAWQVAQRRELYDAAARRRRIYRIFAPVAAAAAIGLAVTATLLFRTATSPTNADRPGDEHRLGHTISLAEVQVERNGGSVTQHQSVIRVSAVHTPPANQSFAVGPPAPKSKILVTTGLAAAEKQAAAGADSEMLF